MLGRALGEAVTAPILTIPILLYQFLTNSKSGSSQPKQVSLPFSSLNASTQEGLSFAYSLSACTVSSMNPPTVPSESSTPPRHNLSSSRKSISTRTFAVCLLTGNSETIFDKRLHPSESALWYANHVRDGPSYDLIYRMLAVMAFFIIANSFLLNSPNRPLQVTCDISRLSSSESGLPPVTAQIATATMCLHSISFWPR